MKLIREYIDYQSLDFLSESDNSGKKWHYIVGPFLQSDDKNRNGRRYPKNLIEREVNKYNKTRIATNRAMGELEHPNGPQINLDRVSHLITEMYMDGKYGMGKAKLLDTPCGKIAQNLIEGGVQLGVSSRGVGTLRGDVVNDDFDLITVDIVADPSAPDAYVDGIMESKSWILENGIYVESAKQDIVSQQFENFEKKISNGSSYTRKLALQEFLDKSLKMIENNWSSK